MKGNEQIELQAQRYLYERAHLSGSCVVTTFDPFDLEQAFIDGAEWQYEQFEKERLKHCDELTAEQAQMESDFVVQHLKNFNRTPTFIDAIKYGMRLQKEQMMAKAFPVEIDSSRSDGRCILSGNFARFETGDKVKVIVIKEE